MSEKPLIIVLDDEAEQLSAIRRMLHSTAVRVETCTTLDEVMALLRREPASVVLSDQFMPDLLGLDALAQIRTQSPETILGLMSGRGDLALATRAINEGLASFYLPKPIRKDELIAVLERSIKQFDSRRAMEDELKAARNQSMVDSLTGLFNRRYLEAEQDRLLSSARRHQSPLSLFFIDVNDFKSINDTRGHDVGDQALVAVARWLKACCRTEDTVGRFGGDEFMILAPATDPAQAKTLTTRLNASPVEVDPGDGTAEPVRIALSIGAATWPDDGDDPEQLLQIADQAMYAAKRRAKQAAAKRTSAEREADGGAPPVRPVVLFVDDEDQVRATLARQMRLQSFVALFAENGESALAMLRDRTDILCVVSDMKMPGMDGIELLGQVRREFPQTARFLLTAHADFQSAAAAINRAHVQGLLIKPWKLEELTREIQRALRDHPRWQEYETFEPEPDAPLREDSPVPSAPAAAHESPPDPAVTTGGKGEIVLVDDEVRILQMLERQLGRAGYCTFATTQPAEALARIRGSDSALLIADDRLPGVTGETLIAEATSAKPTLRAIVITAHDTREATSRLSQSETVVRVLAKPWEREDLLDAVAQTLKSGATGTA